MTATDSPFTPDFFILGFPKSGTTSLARMMDGIDGFRLSSVKEPHFFTRQFTAMRGVDTEEGYAALFEGTEADDLSFEASTWYAYDLEAVQRILDRRPDARFILCLRDPLKMALSLHGHALRQTYEDVTDPVRAWELQESRGWGENLPANPERPEVLRYRHLSALGTHYAALARLVPEGRLYACFLEDLSMEDTPVIHDIAAFLDRSALAGHAVPKENPSRLYRAPILRRLEKASRENPALRGIRSALRRIGAHGMLQHLLFRPFDASKGADTDRFASILAQHRREQLALIAETAESLGHARVLARARKLLAQAEGGGVSSA